MSRPVSFMTYVKRLAASGLAARIKRFYVVPIIPGHVFAIVCVGDRGPAAAREARRKADPRRDPRRPL